MNESMIEQISTGGCTNKILAITQDPNKEERSSKKHTRFLSIPVKYRTVEVDLKLCLES